MDNESFKTLQILDEVSRNNAITQRTLSRRLGVALGLTNLYLKRLIKKGYIKVVNIKPNRLRYELTPKGIAHKTSLSFKYIQNTFHFYRDVRGKLKECFEQLVRADCRDVVFYGADEVAEIAYLSLQEVPLRLVGIVDDKRVGKNFCGYRVLSTDALMGMEFDRLIIPSLTDDIDVEDILGRIGVDEEKIFWLKTG